MMKKNGISTVHSTRQNSPPRLKNRFLIPLLLFPLLFFGGCELITIGPAEPDLSTLPPITQTGENTFGCKVNGKIWRPKSILGRDGLKWERRPNNGVAIFPAYYTDQEDRDAVANGDTLVVQVSVEVILGDQPIEENVLYEFDTTTTSPYEGGGGVDVSYKLNTCEFGETGNGATSAGWIRFSKYDPYGEEGIIAGEFAFTAYPPTPGPELYDCIDLTEPFYVTEGRFDIDTK